MYIYIFTYRERDRKRHVRNYIQTRLEYTVGVTIRN